MATSSADMSAEGGNSNENELVLYHHYFSFHSQKVALALHEKRLTFKTKLVNIFKGENLEPWFVQMNPASKIPVLKDGMKIIPDSGRIIEYLEDNFSNGDTPRLMPGKGTVQYQKMKELQEKLELFPNGLIAFAVCHPELTINSKITPVEIKMRKGRFPKVLTLLEDLSARHPELKEHYAAKKKTTEETLTKLQDVEQAKKALAQALTILDAMEEELATHAQNEEKANWWLCDAKFTVADIYLTLTLLRLDYTGFWEHFFGKGQRPHLCSYYKLVQQRPAFKKLVTQPPGMMGAVCENKCVQTAMAAVLGTATVVGLVAAAAVVYKRIK